MSMPFSPDLIPDAVARYRRERDRYVKLADRIAEICREDICEQNAIRAQVTFRVKTPKSFEGKLKRFSTRQDKTYNDVDEIFVGIGDFAGVRIATYRHEDCEEVVKHLLNAEMLTGPTGEIEIDRKDKNAQDKDNYYRAIHAQVALREDQQVGIYDNVGDISCEIQICTMIAHVWNEIEHDIGYKPDLGAPNVDERVQLSLLGTLVRKGDEAISALLDAHSRRAEAGAKTDEAEPSGDVFVDQFDFVTRMRGFSGNTLVRFPENSGQLFRLVQDLDIASPARIMSAISPLDLGELTATFKGFRAHLATESEDQLIPDTDTSDLLLLALLLRRSDEVMETFKGRAGRGRGAPTRLHRIAARFQRFRASQAAPVQRA